MVAERAYSSHSRALRAWPSAKRLWERCSQPLVEHNPHRWDHVFQQLVLQVELQAQQLELQAQEVLPQLPCCTLGHLHQQQGLIRLLFEYCCSHTFGRVPLSCDLWTFFGSATSSHRSCHLPPKTCQPWPPSASKASLEGWQRKVPAR